MTKHNLLITGIPRSGTSYLCTLLNRVKNTVVINEPAEVLKILRNDSPVGLAQYYAFIRQQINNKSAIANKIANGKFIEDTNVTDIRTYYSPNVDNPDFVLGTKNTLVYLTTIEKTAQILPDATLVTCIRHPYDTIVSWSNVSFPHIRNAEPRFLLHYASDREKRAINDILDNPDKTERYAKWWEHMSRIIINNADELLIIRYEDMVSDPQGSLNQIYSNLPLPAATREPIEPSAPRLHRDVLDNKMRDTIDKYCTQSAALLGYEL